eukprot:2564221-Prymnesium_polylepis.1
MCIRDRPCALLTPFNSRRACISSPPLPCAVCAPNACNVGVSSRFKTSQGVSKRFKAFQGVSRRFKAFQGVSSRA